MHNAIVPSLALDQKILDYVLTLTEQSRTWWTKPDSGTHLSRRNEILEYRLRMEGRRSVAELYRDVKVEPFIGAANIGFGIEGIFSEFLIPLFMANTHDLDPMLQVRFKGTKKVSEDLTAFHDHYHRYEVPEKRDLLEASNRELLTVGSVFHKWSYGRFWSQAESELPVWASPLTNEPMMQFDQGTGQMMPVPADPATPKDAWPIDPISRTPMKIMRLKSVSVNLKREGPELSIRRAERITFPTGETRVDPNLWDWMAEDFEVSPIWLLGKQGDPFDGKLKLNRLWKWMSIDPNTIHREPEKLARMKKVRMRAFHGKYPATSSGQPIEITVIVATEAKLNLGWRPSPYPRRPYFNRQVWSSGDSPIGRGIPETVYSLRSAMDALLNQEIDSGNLYNHPPLLISDLAMIDDEEYESTGPGAVWIMRDINGAKFLPTTMHRRDPVSLLDWLISNTMRKWGVTDLTLNAPQGSLSPNVKTASGLAQIINQGNIKFGHLVKRLSASDTREFQYVHDSFQNLLANPKQVTLNGEPKMIGAEAKEAYFSDRFEVLARGDGVSTNPVIRQQLYSQLMTQAVSMQNPFLIGDLEIYKKITDEWVSSFGIHLETKDPELLQLINSFTQLMETPQGQQVLPQVIQQLTQKIQEEQALLEASGEGGKRGGSSAAPVNRLVQPVGANGSL